MELIRRRLRDIATEYAAISITPNGEKKMIASGGSFARFGDDEIRALKATPVDHAAKAPHAIPKPGMNIGNATEALWPKIPIALIPSTAC